jgi:hypothetical protein
LERRHNNLCRLPQLEELRLERRPFAGITAWSPLDNFDAGSSAVNFVGNPEGIAGNVKVYRDEAKLSAPILSGWPLIEEAETVSQLFGAAARGDPLMLRIVGWSIEQRILESATIQLEMSCHISL